MQQILFFCNIASMILGALVDMAHTGCHDPNESEETSSSMSNLMNFIVMFFTITLLRINDNIASESKSNTAIILLVELTYQMNIL